MYTNSLVWKTAVALAGVGAYLAAQSGPNLSARELFFVPEEAKKPAPVVSKAAPPATAPKVQVAAKEKTPAKVAVPTAPGKEVRTDNEVRIVSAGYSGPRPLGLKYNILRQSAPRTFRPVNVDTVFHSGDSIRVRVESNENGYLYILTRGSSGAWTVLFPNKTVRGGDNFVTAGEKYDLPSPEHRWTFDEKKGEEKLFLVLSRKPVTDVDKLIYDLNDNVKPAAAPAKAPATPVSQPSEPPRRVLLAQNTRPIDDQVVGRLRSQVASRDLVFEAVSEPAPTTSSAEPNERIEAAAYVVEKSGKADARLVADVKLKHE